jgi:paraquat-inducible protein A
VVSPQIHLQPSEVTSEIAAPVSPAEGELIACPDCGREQTLPPLAPHTVASCVRCGRILDAREPPDSTPLALAVAGAIAAVLSNFFPIIEVRLAGREQADLLFTGPKALSADGFGVLGALVACFTIVIPLLWPLLLGPTFRFAERLRPWAMTEVFVIGAYVAYTRLQSLGHVAVGFGGAATAATALLTFLVDRTLDRRHVWDSIAPPEMATEGWRPELSCPACDLLTHLRAGTRCPRCGAVLRRRKPASISRTVALTVAGAALYVPANVLPIMSVGRFGRPEPTTIVSGIGELFRLRLWPLGLIVLFASVLIPVLKLVSLGWFVLAIRRRSSLGLRFRTRLYRLVDGVGRWSNIDIFMISILVALVQFGFLATVRAGAGAVAFAAVVIVTMFAAMAFDPRLMWDAVEGDG